MMKIFLNSILASNNLLWLSLPYIAEIWYLCTLPNMQHGK